MTDTAAKTPVTQRVEFVDTARGIAMLCIVLGHLDIHAVNLVVYTFHVPIFFLITGWFVSARQSVGAFTSRRARTLLVPYAVTCAVIVVGMCLLAALGAPAAEGQTVGNTALRWIVAALYGSGTPAVPLPSGVTEIGAIWFLLACFWGCVGLRALLEIRYEWLRAVLALAAALVGVFTASVFFLPFSLQPGMVALGYMYVGWAARAYLWPRVQQWPKAAKVAAVCVAAAVWAFYMIWADTVLFAQAYPGRYWWSIFGILSACLCVMLLSRLLCRVWPNLGRGLAYLGKFSLIMLCVHLLEMEFIDYWALAGALQGLGAPYVVAAGSAVLLKFVLIIGGTVLLSKWPAARKLFGYAN